MEIVERKIADLIGAEYNPRKLSADQFQNLKDSLTRFGMAEPIVVNMHAERENIVVGGHQRLKVWGSMGNKVIPTVEVVLDADKERELNVRLNKNSGEFDYDLLNEHFEQSDLLEWGFSEDELSAFDVDEIDPPELNSGDKEPFRQMTFTVHDEQFEEIEAAIKSAKGEGG